MEIETKIISTETIKPSSPTPKSLQKHHLSFLDQLMPPIFISYVYFYQSNPKNPNPQNSDHLRKCLSETLSRFYPLAGRLVGNLYVDCNDAGVPFSEAEADCTLSQVIYNPNPKDMNKFLPDKTDDPQDFLMAAQTTSFRCGGFAVGILISHKIAGASSIVMFANTWSAFARCGDAGGVPLPTFDAAAYCPPVDMSWFNSAAGMVKEELATRIFTFSADTIALLQKRYSSGGDGDGGRPSREEALATFIWTRFISATGVRSDPRKASTQKYPVNLRGRVDPPLSYYNFGNIFLLKMVKPAVGDGGIELLRKVVEAVKAADVGFVARLNESEKHLHLMKEMLAQAENGGELVSFSISSRCGLPSYEADFGSGRPVWIGLGELPYKNLAIFTDAKNEGGIEALIHLTKQDMKKFEGDLEVQIFIENNFGADLKLPLLKSKM